MRRKTVGDDSIFFNVWTIVDSIFFAGSFFGILLPAYVLQLLVFFFGDDEKKKNPYSCTAKVGSNGGTKKRRRTNKLIINI